MHEDEKIIIETIKSGKLPEINLSESVEQNRLHISQRGLEIANYSFSSKNQNWNKRD